VRLTQNLKLEKRGVICECLDKGFSKAVFAASCADAQCADEGYFPGYEGAVTQGVSPSGRNRAKRHKDGCADKAIN